jgi:magnesium-transporting ATPase (P-type)
MMKDIDQFLTKASVKGLRTLLMAMRVIDESEYKAFLADISSAEKDVINREKLLAQIYDKFERGLVLLGATAVEDRLQDNVPETINDLQEAGIKIWMLTGDKLETAENIGYSCKLLKNDMIVWKIANREEVEYICSETKVSENN